MPNKPSRKAGRASSCLLKVAIWSNQHPIAFYMLSIGVVLGLLVLESRL